MGAQGSGRPLSPRAQAEGHGVDAYALVEYLGNREEVRRLKQEHRWVIDFLTETYAEVDAMIDAARTPDEIRAAHRWCFDRLMRFHDEHYEFSERNTEAICEGIKEHIREAQRQGSWWQTGTVQVALPGLAAMGVGV